MKRTSVQLTVLGAVALTLLSAGAQTPPAVDKISILPSRINARIILEGNPLPAALKSSYSTSLPAVLQVEFGPARWPQPPAVPADESPLLQGLQVEVQPNGRTLLFLALTEKVPFRIFSEGPRTIIELQKIQRQGGDYLIAPETQKELGADPRPGVDLKTIAVADTKAGLEVSARLGRKPIANIFALDNPLRLIVDVFDAVYGGPTDKRPIGKFGVDAVKVGQFMTGHPYTITRLVFDLNRPRQFALIQGPADLTVSFGPDSADAASAPAPENPAPAGLISPVVKTETKTAPAVQASGSNGTGVKAKEIKSGAVVMAEPPLTPPKPQAETVLGAQKKDEKYQPLTIYNPEQKYSGERYSPRFKDADIRDVILWLGEEVGLNVIFDDEVKGTVTCSFDQIPWDQFLDIILKNKKLGKTLEGSVLRIAPMAVLTREQTENQQLTDAREQSGPLLTKTYALSYAKAKDIELLIKSKKSQRGEISVDDRTNTLVLVDTKDKLDLIEKLIEVLDTATPQVSIEARIVEATSTFVRNMGIQWGAKGISDPYYGNQTSLRFPNKVLVDGALIPEGLVTKGIGGPLGGYAVNLPAPAFNSAIGFSLANVLDTFRLDLALSALETSGNGKIISCPKVTAQNNQEAEIIQGRQIPVQTVANFTVSTRYMNAALELKATPQITAEGTIIMNLDIKNNAADFGNLVNGIPPITTQSAKTTVMVPDGGTTVIGGIYRMEDSTTRDGVPILSKIPILGNLFRNFARTKQNRELLIFITPRIMK